MSKLDKTSFVRRLQAAVLLACVLIANTGWSAPLARNVQFSNLTARDGLSSEFVHAVAQDADGFIWFGTQDGLNRFDGHQVVVYEHDPADPASLANNFIWDLFVDSKDRLWVATNRGLSRYDPQRDQFENDPFRLAENQAVGRVRAVFEDRSGVFWVATLDDGLLAVEPSGSVRHFRHDASQPNGLPSDSIIDLLEDNKGRLWIGTDGQGLSRFEASTETFITHRSDPGNAHSLSDDTVRALYEDRAGNLWIGTASGGLNLMLDSGGRFRRFPNDPNDPSSLGTGQVTAVLEDARGTLWVGTETGLYEWRPDASGFVRYQRDSGDLASLASNRVNAIAQDRSGVLWLATHGGVSSWNYFSDPFVYYDRTQGFLENDLVTSIAERRDGILWVGTYGGGLAQIDLANGTTRHFRADDQVPGGLNDDRVMALHVDHQDRLWIGTRNRGLNLLNPDGRTFSSFVHEPSTTGSLSGNGVTSIYSDADGTLWVGVFGGGLNRMHPLQPGKFETFRHDPTDVGSLSSDRVLMIQRDRAGTLWIGTERGGLNRFDSETQTFERFPVTGAQDTRPDDLGTPWNMVEERDGTLWVATMGDGLLRIQPRALGEDLSITRFGTADGMAPTIYGLLLGNDGDVWASSNRGLYRLDPETRDVRQFDQRNGLRGTEFSPNAQERSRSGRLLFGGNKGVVGFFPGELPRNRTPPNISVRAESRTSLLTTGSSLRPPDAISLPYLDTFVSFNFVALDMVSPDKNQYRYRLHGFDADWVPAGHFRHARYTNLPSGSFRFQVQASNNDGVWNEEGVSVDIDVIAPPWRNAWAILGYVLVGLSLVFWYLYAQKTRSMRAGRAREALEAQVTERTSELASRNAELSTLNQELSTLNDKLSEASVTDSLTGLRNRRFVDQFIATEVSGVDRRRQEVSPDSDNQRDSSQMLYFMMIDLDGFKTINDTFGHQAGDRVLVQVKDVLVACCRTSDALIRWGGDEFMVIGHVADFEGVQVLAERIRDTIARRPFHVGNGNIGRISASIGMAPYPFSKTGEPISWEVVANVADQAAYLAKQNGRNAWVSIDATTELPMEAISAAPSELNRLVESGALRIETSVEGGVVIDQPPARTGTR